MLPSDLLTPLHKEEDCPLMPDPPVQRFNRLIKVLADIQQQFPQQHQLLSDLAATLSHVRTRLSRKYFQIGFVGRNQIGKSTTFNRMVGSTTDDDDPSPKGNFRATTSSVLRLRSRPPGGARTVQVRFLNQDEYRKKRDALAKVLGEDKNFDDTALLAQLTKKAPNGTTEKPKLLGIGPQAEPALFEDPKYLRRLIENAGYVGKPTVACPWDQRRNFLQNNAGVPWAPLIKDVVMEYPNNHISKELELIDLPGLGAENSVDSIITEELMADLDGAVVCFTLTNLSEGATLKALRRLCDHFHWKLEGCLWLVITFFQGLTEKNLTGDMLTPGIFENVVETLAPFKVPLPQVSLLSNAVFEEKLRDPSMSRKDAGRLIGIAAEPDIPPQLQKYPGLHAAHRAAYEDGGYGRLRQFLGGTFVESTKRTGSAPSSSTALRQFLGGTFVESVRQRLLDEVNLLIDEMKQLVRDRLETVVQKTSQEDLENAIRAVQGRLDEIDAPRPAVLEKQAETIQQKLETNFSKTLFQNTTQNNQLSLPVLKQRFTGQPGKPGHADALDGEFVKLVNDGVKNLYAELGKPFKTLTPIAVAGKKSVALAWEHFADQDKDVQTWRTLYGDWFPTFNIPELFVALEAIDPALVHGTLYREVLLEKIQVSSQQVAHVLRLQLRKRLKQLDRELDQLSTSMNGIGTPAALSTYQALICELEQL